MNGFMEKKHTYRHEIKYLLDARDALLLRNRLAAVLVRDRHTNETGRYRVRSLYFDDVKNTDLFSKLAGEEQRKKYRIRYYNDDTTFIRFEKKVKENDVSYKRAAPLSYQQALLLSRGEFDCIAESEDALLREIYCYHRENLLRPAVITDYDREAFIHPAGNVRVTFDADLRTSLLGTELFNPRLPSIPAVGPGQVVLEVKYDHFLPSLISQLLGGTSAKKMSISKFSLCKKYILQNDWEVYS